MAFQKAIYSIAIARDRVMVKQRDVAEFIIIMTALIIAGNISCHEQLGKSRMPR